MGSNRRNPTTGMVLRYSLLIAAMLVISAARAGPTLGGDFTLTRLDGTPFSLKSLRGEVVVLAFGYTSCPDVCPTTLSNVSRLMQALGAESKQVVPVFITVDPRRDKPDKLREYLRYFSPAVVGVTGTEAEVLKVAKQYGSFVRYRGDKESGRYEVDHSGSIYLIDRNGRLARIVPNGMPASQLVESVYALLPDASDQRARQ